MPVSTRRRARGTTLIETVVVLAVVAIIAGIAMPAFATLLQAARVRTAVADLSADLALARISAISRGRAYVLCPSSDGLACRRDGRWDTGWIGFHGGGSPATAPASGPASVRQRRDDGIRIVSGSGRPQVRYLPDGRSAGTNLTINICAGARLSARVVVNNAGRPRTERVRVGVACPG